MYPFRFQATAARVLRKKAGLYQLTVPLYPFLQLFQPHKVSILVSSLGQRTRTVFQSFTTWLIWMSQVALSRR